MDAPTKRPRSFSAATIVLTLVMLYLASFGPACWIELRRGFADTNLINAVYFPVMWGWERTPYPIYNWIKLYANGGRLGRHVMVPHHGGLCYYERTP